jgi:hypothetical protein
MAKLTVSDIKKQIAALEAKAARLAEEETMASVGKVRALMNQLGVTLEHLSSSVSRKASAVKKAIAGKKPATAKRTSKGAAKYHRYRTTVASNSVRDGLRAVRSKSNETFSHSLIWTPPSLQS